jgi:hypothetical protein
MLINGAAINGVSINGATAQVSVVSSRFELPYGDAIYGRVTWPCGDKIESRFNIPYSLRPAIALSRRFELPYGDVAMLAGRFELVCSLNAEHSGRFEFVYDLDASGKISARVEFPYSLRVPESSAQILSDSFTLSTANG